MATVTKPIALDESFNTTELTPRNIADVLAQELSRITGRNASQVEYDNTDSGLTADNVQDALDEINGKIPTVPSVDIQTAVDEFSTYNGGILDSLKVALSPNQNLHGFLEPWVGGSKKNKLPLILADIKANNTSGTWNGNVYTKDGIDFTILTDNADNVLGINANGISEHQVGITLANSVPISAGSYILNGTASGSGWTTSWLNVRVNTTNYNDIGSGASFTVSEASTMTAYCYIASGATVSNKVFLPMIRLATESDPTFEPYSNICPISGHTQVDVDVSNPNLIEEMQNGVWLATNGTYSVIAGYCCSKKFRIAPNKTYNVFATADATIGTDNAVLFYDENDNYLGQNTGGIIRSTTVPFTFTAPSNAYYCALDLKVTLSNLLTAEIVADKEQVTVNLGGTYYSGTLDVVSGVFTPDTAKTTINDCISNRTTSYNHPVFYGTISGLKNGNPIMYSDKLRIIEGKTSASDFASNSENGDFTNNSYNTGASIQVFLRMDDYSDVASLKSAIGDAEIVYELATPTPIQLSPTMVKALVGENHLSAPLDGQEITESKYKQTFTFDDVIAYIQSLS